MENNDPWDWPTDRVVQEFCTSERSWPLRSASMAAPDPVSLEKALRQEQVTGDSLLNDIDDAVMRSDLGLRTIGQRAFVNHGINILRLRSTKYQAKLRENLPENEYISRLSRSVDEMAELFRRSTSGLSLEYQKQLGHTTDQLMPPHNTSTLINATYSEDPTDDVTVQVNGIDSGDVANKRHKPDTADLIGDVDHQYGDDMQGHGISTPALKINTEPSLDSSKKRKRIAPTLVTSEINLNRNREIPTAADEVIIYDPNRNHRTSDIDEITEEIQQNSEPGVIFIDGNGRKRLVLVRQADAANDPLQQPVPNEPGASSAENQERSSINIDKQRVVNNHKTSISYLGRKKLAVDKLFYPDTAVGEDLPELDESTEFELTSTDVPHGRRLYVHNVMKRFLRAGRQYIVRGPKLFSAVTPYSEQLVLRHQKQSFTLFYTNENGECRTRREEVPSWPEIDTAATSKPNFADEHTSTFNPTGPGILENLGRYEESFDPSYLENKYKYLDGGDEILPIYGESDEENEYDAATWREMEEERGGKITRPLGVVKRAQLSTEEIEEAIGEGISELIKKWTKYKLPRQARKSYRLWRKSRKEGDKRVRIIATQKDLQIIHRRISNMRKEILEDVWTSRAQVLKQIPIMEVDVFTREDLNYKIKILEQSFCPDKPQPISSTTDSRESAVQNQDSEEGESIGSEGDVSSSDDSLEDFVVADEPLPTTEQELHELNLADSGDEIGIGEEEEDVDISDISMPGQAGDLLSALSKIGRAVKSKQGGLSTGTSHEPTSLSPSSLNNVSTPVKAEDPSLPPSFKSSKQPEVYDLTMLSSDDSSVNPKGKAIDVSTAQKPKFKLNVRNRSSRRISSPIDLVDSDDDPMPDQDNLPPLTDPKAVAKFSYVVWARLFDSKRLLLLVFYRMETPMRTVMLNFLSSMSESELWSHLESVIDAYKAYYERPKSDSQLPFKGVRGMDSTTLELLSGYIRLFEIYIDCCYHAWREPPTPWSLQKVVDEQANQFTAFFDFCATLEDIFSHQSNYLSSPTSSRKDCINAGGKGKVAVSASEGEDYDEDDEDIRPLSKRRYRDVTTSEDEVVEETISRKKKRVNKIFENADARRIRDQVKLQQAKQEERKKELLAKLAKRGHVNDEVGGRIIVNDAANENELHYITPHIASRIKWHQVEGVRFMWNQIVAGLNEEARQGCLLAHTMGLGKTMQVITLLVAIAEAVASADPLISSQIPKKLQRSQTLVLCPPTLIDNWMDELLTWIPNDALGPLDKITTDLSPAERLQKIAKWNEDGGVLIIGYDMFRNIIGNKKNKKTDMAPLTDAQHEVVMKHLLDGPNIIIADEAHKMKNPTAAITLAAKQFKSNSRIALTGSPLANNVEEYFAMIDWVAPNYLGPIVEFRAKYVEPIQLGLWSDSTSGERRRALKMLKVLNDTLKPKVHRADMSVLRDDLPLKKEFVITVPLTDLQKKVYSLYVRSMASSSVSTTKSGEVSQTTIWHWLTVLSLICNHPKCFDIKIHDRKDKSRKGGAVDPPSPQDLSDVDGAILDINVPSWKIGVSQELVEAATKLFQEEAPDLDSIDLSHKVQILCQILDASKAIGDKVLIFSSSIPTIDFLEQLCQNQHRNYARLDGKTKMNKRQGMTKEFNTGATDVFLISTTAGGLGLNLFGANRVIIFDFKFNPIMEEQAVGRAYRMGQQKPTFVYRFVSGGTFEDHVHNKTVFKMQLAKRVVDKKSPVAYATRKLSEFLFEPKEVKQSDLSEFRGRDPLVLDKILASQRHSTTIYKIVEDAAFDKDDEDKLTAEEEKEATRLFKDETIRRTDPKQWQALVAKRNQQAHEAEFRRVHLLYPQRIQTVKDYTQAQQQGLQQQQGMTDPPTQKLRSDNNAHLQTSSGPLSSSLLPMNKSSGLAAQQLAISNIQTSDDLAAMKAIHGGVFLNEEHIALPTLESEQKKSIHSGRGDADSSLISIPAEHQTQKELNSLEINQPDTEVEANSKASDNAPNNNTKASSQQTSSKGTKDLSKSPSFLVQVREALLNAGRVSDGTITAQELPKRDEAALGVAQSIRKEIESVFKNSKSQRVNTMRLASIRLGADQNKCHALLNAELSVHDFIKEIVKSARQKSSISNGNDITNVGNPDMFPANARLASKDLSSDPMVESPSNTLPVSTPSGAVEASNSPPKINFMKKIFGSFL